MYYFKEIAKRYKIYDIILFSIFLEVVLYLIDYYNVITSFYSKYNIPFNCIFVFLFFAFIIKIVKIRIWNYFKSKTINYIDKLIIIGLNASFLLLINYFTMYVKYKNMLFFMIALQLIIIFYRNFYINKLKKESDDNSTLSLNIYDLFYFEIEKKKHDIVILNEEALHDEKKDLLDINLFVNSISDSLIQYQNKHTHTMSLIGKWGCGKTSVINLIKNKFVDNDSLVIKNFEPWKYDDKLSLFHAFYEFILNTFNENLSYLDTKKFFEKIENIIFGFVNKKTNLNVTDLFNNVENNNIISIKNSINDCISLNEKKLIIIIDDIDRLDKEQILLIFKTIKTIFDFENIIYILCYDENRINKVFEDELKIDSEYIDKIVQNKLVMPIIDKNQISNISKTCIENLLKFYNIIDYDCERLEKILTLISSNFNNIRELIRFINTISVSIKCFEKLKLDVVDYIAIEYIKFSNLDLFQQIYTNSEYFVSEDYNYNNGFSIHFASSFNPLAKEILDGIFNNENNKKYLDLLSNVFPYIEKYKNGNPLINDGYYYPNYDRENSIKSIRCYNGRFFKCYFIMRHSFFTELNILVDNFIKNVNSSYDIEGELNKIYDEVNPNNHDLLLNLIAIRLSEINHDYRNNIFEYILKNIESFEDGDRFLDLNSKERAKILLSKIIEIEPDILKQKEYLVQLLDTDIVLYENTLYWLKPDKYGRKDNNKEIYEYGLKILDDKLNEIVKTKKNIFDDEKYQYRFCWVFYRGMFDKDKCKKYLTSLINKNTIFKVLGECISVWVGNGERYEYNESNLNLIFNKPKIERELKKVDYELNASQKKILEVYRLNNRDNNIKNINFNEL